MASTYLSWTPSNTGTRTTFTWSFWVKRHGLGSYQKIHDADYNNDGNYYSSLFFKNDDTLVMSNIDAGSTNINWASSRKFRDTNAWYHIVVTFDTTNGTANDRIRVYVNGERETLTGTFAVAQNTDNTFWNRSGNKNWIGAKSVSVSDYLDATLSHFHFIDGTAYNADTFGETDSTTGIWKPKTAPSVTYGTNGFFLKFENSGAMGTDSAGSNNWTVNGTMTQLIDTPSNVFATLNPLAIPTSGGANSFSNGNLEMTNSADAFRTTFATLGTSKGKYYWEAKFLSGEMKQMIGVSKPQETMDFVGQSSGSWGWQNENARRYNNNSYTSYGSTASSGDIIMVAFDATNGAIWVGKNGSWFNSATQSEIEAGTVTNAMFSSITIDDYFLPAFTTEDSNIQVNFGNGYFGTTAVSSAQNPDDGIGIFEYDVPAGYRALCTKSINAEEYS